MGEEMGEKSLRAHGNLSAHKTNSDADQTRGPNSSQHRFCIRKTVLEWLFMPGGPQKRNGTKPS